MARPRGARFMGGPVVDDVAMHWFDHADPSGALPPALRPDVRAAATTSLAGHPAHLPRPSAADTPDPTGSSAISETLRPPTVNHLRKLEP